MTNREPWYDSIEADANFRPRTLFESLAGPRPHEVLMAKAILADRDRRERRLAELGTWEEYEARLGRASTIRDRLAWSNEHWEICMKEGMSDRLQGAMSRRREIEPLGGGAAVLAIIVVVLVGALVGLLLF